MKPYGAKKNKKIEGDGCFLCMPERKETKTAVRSKVRAALQKQIERDREREFEASVERTSFLRKLSF